MINIKETVKTPSAALQYMVDGLLKQSKRRNFIIDMGTFGTVSGGQCFGCAATCAIQEVAGKDLDENNLNYTDYRAQALDFNIEELDVFEVAIDNARSGMLSRLFMFFGAYSPELEELCYAKWDLGSHNWRKQLPLVQEHIAKLKAAGF